MCCIGVIAGGAALEARVHMLSMTVFIPILRTVLGGHFVLTLKNADTRDETAKDHLVALVSPKERRISLFTALRHTGRAPGALKCFLRMAQIKHIQPRCDSDLHAERGSSFP